VVKVVNGAGVVWMAGSSPAMTQGKDEEVSQSGAAVSIVWQRRFDTPLVMAGLDPAIQGNRDDMSEAWIEMDSRVSRARAGPFLKLMGILLLAVTLLFLLQIALQKFDNCRFGGEFMALSWLIGGERVCWSPDGTSSDQASIFYVPPLLALMLVLLWRRLIGRAR